MSDVAIGNLLILSIYIVTYGMFPRPDDNWVANLLDVLLFTVIVISFPLSIFKLVLAGWYIMTSGARTSCRQANHGKAARQASV